MSGVFSLNLIWLHTMEIFLHFGFTLVGIFFLLIGWRVIKPKQTQTWLDSYAKWSWLYKYGGVAMVMWGVLQVLIGLRVL